MCSANKCISSTTNASRCKSLRFISNQQISVLGLFSPSVGICNIDSEKGFTLKTLQYDKGDRISSRPLCVSPHGEHIISAGVEDGAITIFEQTKRYHILGLNRGLDLSTVHVPTSLQETVYPARKQQLSRKKIC